MVGRGPFSVDDDAVSRSVRVSYVLQRRKVARRKNGEAVPVTPIEEKQRLRPGSWALCFCSSCLNSVQSLNRMKEQTVTPPPRALANCKATGRLPDEFRMESPLFRDGLTDAEQAVRYGYLRSARGDDDR